MSQVSLISTCTSHQLATLRELLPRVNLHIYQELYKDLPEETIAEKVIKLRCMHNLEREELARILNFHVDTLESWELCNVIPKPESIKKLCEYFNVYINYFHEYYTIYYDRPYIEIRKWKDKKQLTYPQITELLNITHSAFGRLVNGKLNLSYSMYLKLKELSVF